MNKFLNLQKAIFDKIEEIGVEKAAKLFSKSETAIKKWQSGSGIPDVSAAQIVLDEAFQKGLELPVPLAAPPQGKTIPEPPAKGDEPKPMEFGDPEQKMGPPEPLQLQKTVKKFSILSPTNRDYGFATVLSMLGNWKSTLPPEIRSMLSGLDIESDTLIHRARNILATRFLEHGNEWSYWMDSDIIAPIGNPGWFRKRSGARYSDEMLRFSALEKLTSYQGKKIVSGVYCQRSQGGLIIAQPGLAPKGAEDALLVDEIKSRGPQHKIVQVDWVGFGCVAVHRQVFLDILEKFPGVASANPAKSPHGFFTAYEGGPQGEDVAFCKRAAESGHPSYLDLSVICGHTGRFAFLP